MNQPRTGAGRTGRPHRVRETARPARTGSETAGRRTTSKLGKRGLATATAILALLLIRTAVAVEAPGIEVPAAVLAVEQQRIEAIRRAIRPTISIFARQGQTGGSGVIVTPDGYALSNFHVTQPAGDYMQCSLADGTLVDAVIVGIAPTGDLSLIKLLGRDDFPAASLADSDQVRVGDWCFAVGNPFLLATDFQPTVTYGIVSGVNRYQYPAGTLLEYADCIQTDAAINPGNSGGPLFNADGQLIGIIGRGSFERRGRVNVGVGYAISINQARNFLGSLKSGRIVDNATLGATVSSDEDGRVIVTEILEHSDAYRRGLRYGAEIVSFGGRPITTVNGFKNVLGIFPQGWRVPLSFRWEGRRHDVHVRLMGVHTQDELLTKATGAGLPEPDLPTPERPPEPEPRPADAPQPHQDVPEEPRDEAPKIERRSPVPGTPAARRREPLPDHIAPWFETRTGFTNFHFNRLHRDRVWQAWQKHGVFPSQETWQLRGTTSDGQAVHITLGPDQARADFAGQAVEIDIQRDLDQQRGPQGSGGLLVALHLWQRLLQLGPERFGEVYYEGTAPLPGRSGLYDVLVGVHDVVETRFFFDPASGELVALEMFAESDADPCELYWSDYQRLGEQAWPRRLTVRHGEDLFLELEWEQIGPAPTESAE